MTSKHWFRKFTVHFWPIRKEIVSWMYNNGNYSTLDSHTNTVISHAFAYSPSLRADEIKLWLTPSAKQRRNPCSGLPAVYPDLSTRHDWPVKKSLCFVCRDRQSGWSGIRNALPVIRWVPWGSRTRISALLRRRYYSEFSYRLHAGYTTVWVIIKKLKRTATPTV